MEEVMTNEQARRLELLARLDELDRMAQNTADHTTKEAIDQRKKAIREQLDTLL